jgi:hypothetical protein
MGFGQWEFFGNPGTGALDTIEEILGDTSVIISSSGGFNRGTNVQVTAASGITRGIGRGKIRTLLKHVSGTNADGGNFGGIFCLGQNQDVHSVGTCYFLGVEPDDTTGSGEIRLFRAELADAGNVTPLATYSLGYSSGEIISLELEWNEDTAGDIGGTHLIARQGILTSYADLDVRFQYVDNSGSRLTLGSGYEGIGISDDSTSGAVTSWVFDNTTIFSIA